MLIIYFSFIQIIWFEIRSLLIISNIYFAVNLTRIVRIKKLLDIDL